MLTKQQSRALKFIAREQKRNHICPSMTEIADHMGLTYPGARVHIVALKRKGYIDYSKGCARSIRIIRGK